MDPRRLDQRPKPEPSTSGDSIVPLGVTLMLAWVALIALALIER